ncbi:MAG: rhodanese-like domain-containing protein [Haloplanus sp.]
MSVHRRRFLAGAGAALGGLAGCLGGGGGGGSVTNLDGYDSIDVEGIAVPLAPLSDVHSWYESDRAKFADARSKTAYDASHIEGAAWSPAPDGQRSNDPVASWDPASLVVTYCNCPHHLSSIRAAVLIDRGYERVAALDDGFRAWHEQGYPVAGDNPDVDPPERVVEGRTDPRFAGDLAWAHHDPTGQREVTTITESGRYALSLRFVDVSLEDEIRVTTPAYELTAPLSALVSSVVGADGRL